MFSGLSVFLAFVAGFAGGTLFGMIVWVSCFGKPRE